MTDDEMGRAWNSMGEVRNMHRPRLENLKIRSHLENLGVNVRIILNGTFVKNRMGEYGLFLFLSW
jgi:hypothetical protein